jgi:hypothetical protein
MPHVGGAAFRPSNNPDKQTIQIHVLAAGSLAWIFCSASEMGLQVNRIYGPIHIAELGSTPSNGSWYYTSGEAVWGTVSVDSRSQAQRIEIIFDGRVDWIVAINPDEYGNGIYNEDVELFSYRLQLFTSSASGQSYYLANLGVTPDNRVMIPFELIFPHTAQSSIKPSSRGEPITRFREQSGFEPTAGHTLLPRYSYDGANSHQRVDYYLEAHIYIMLQSQPDSFVQRPVLYCPPGPLRLED